MDEIKGVTLTLCTEPFENCFQTDFWCLNTLYRGVSPDTVIVQLALQSAHLRVRSMCVEDYIQMYRKAKPCFKPLTNRLEFNAMHLTLCRSRPTYVILALIYYQCDSDKLNVNPSSSIFING